MPSDETILRKFLGTAFWGVGVFCYYWGTQLFIAINRYGELELPAFGRSSEMEAVIFTLTFGWLPLLILHLLVHQHQRLGGERPRFPGAMGSLAVPPTIKWVRFLLFMVLCLWPTFVHVYATGRAFSHYVIIPSGFINKTLNQEEWPAVRKWQLVAYPWTHPSHLAWNSPGARWWVNSREEWVEVNRATQAICGEITVQKKYERVGITAIPLQPMAFLVVAVLLCCSSVMLLTNGLKKRVTART
jgi:hypothetical protein